MRKLSWFAGGFALMCLLLASQRATIWLLLPLSLALLGWQLTQPKRQESWMGLYQKRRVGWWLWQVCRRGVALGVGCGAGLCWFCVYQVLVCLPAQEWTGEQTLSGTVITQPQATDTGGYALVLRLDTGENVALYTPESWGSVQLGDHVQAAAQVEYSTQVYGEDASYYAAKGIFLVGNCGEPPVRKRPQLPPVMCWPGVAAQRLKQGMELAFDQEVAPIAVAVTLGDKSGLSEDVYQTMTRAGVLHAAVVSGLHITFLVGLLLVLCQGRKGLMLGTLPVLVFYALMAGGTASAFRAVWMQAVALAVPWVGREPDSPSALGLALLGLLVQNPFSIASAGLQLSFLSVSGILLLTPKLYHRLIQPVETWEETLPSRVAAKLWRGMCASVAASLGAMVFTVPLMGLLFGQVSLLAPLSNVLVLWAMTALMIGALALGLLALVAPGVAACLGSVVGGLGHYVMWMVDQLGGVSYSVLDIHNPYHGVWLVGAYGVGAVVLVGRVRVGQVALAVMGLAGLLALPIGLNGVTVSQSDLVVVGLDVGQGSSTALLGPGYTVLVDCGGSLTASAGDIAADYLAFSGRTRLDALLLTHLDDDHCNGVKRLVQRMEVEQVWAPISAQGEETGRQLEQWLAQKGIACQWVGEETHLPMEGLEITLYPPLGSGTTNEEGLFALCSAGEFDVLITGDGDSYVEKMLVRYFPPPNIELLVVGHHGSKNSTSMELLGWARPELGLISVGADNSYGHPHEETLERLRRSGVEVHRTDLEGTVTVVVQGNKVGIW